MVEAQIDAPSVKAAKDYFGQAFGDAEEMRVFIKNDPEGYAIFLAEKEKATEETDTTVVVGAEQAQSFKDINTQLETWRTTAVPVKIAAVIDMDAYNAVVAILRTPVDVAVRPYVPLGAADNLRKQIQGIMDNTVNPPKSALQDFIPARPGVNAAPGIAMTNKFYVDGQVFSSIIRGEVMADVARSTVAARSYKRL
jgi:hypothetical protein